MVNSGAKDRDGGAARSRVFSWVQLAIGVGMVVAARFGWLYARAEPEGPPVALAMFLFELPFVFCVLPFISGESSKSSVRSAGMVFGTALSFCPLALLMFLDAMFRIGGKGYRQERLASFLPVCFITAVCMLGVSWIR